MNRLAHTLLFFYLILLEYLTAGNQAGIFAVPVDSGGLCTDINPQVGIQDEGFVSTVILYVPRRAVRAAGGPVVKNLVAVSSFTYYRRNLTGTLVQVSETECLRINYVNPGILIVQKTAEII